MIQDKIEVIVPWEDPKTWVGGLCPDELVSCGDTLQEIATQLCSDALEDGSYLKHSRTVEVLKQQLMADLKTMSSEAKDPDIDFTTLDYEVMRKIEKLLRDSQ